MKSKVFEILATFAGHSSYAARTRRISASAEAHKMDDARCGTAMALAVILPIMFGGQAMAAGFSDCTDKARHLWKPQTEAMAAAKAAGYEVRKIKVEGTCYEVYGVGTDGVLMELFYNPVTMKLMHTVKKG